MDDSREKQLVAKLLWAWSDGSPVAPSTPNQAEEMAMIARRRWDSFGRRNHTDALQLRIRDLAKGLAEKFEDGGFALVGPLIKDYLWLADQIAPLLSSEASDPSDT